MDDNTSSLPPRRPTLLARLGRLVMLGAFVGILIKALPDPPPPLEVEYVWNKGQLVPANNSYEQLLPQNGFSAVYLSHVVIVTEGACERVVFQASEGARTTDYYAHAIGYEVEGEGWFLSSGRTYSSPRLYEAMQPYMRHDLHLLPAEAESCRAALAARPARAAR